MKLGVLSFGPPGRYPRYAILGHVFCGLLLILWQYSDASFLIITAWVFSGSPCPTANAQVFELHYFGQLHSYPCDIAFDHFHLFRYNIQTKIRYSKYKIQNVTTYTKIRLLQYAGKKLHCVSKNGRCVP